MKKPRKALESPSIRCYEQRVRKNLLNNLTWLLVLFIAGVSSAFAGTPAFIIYNDGINLAAEAAGLEQNGAHIRQRVPPQILVVELPPSIRPQQLTGTKTVYTSAIAVNALRPFGPVATAAAMQWNRMMLRNPSMTGQSVGAMRTMVSQKSLPGSPAPRLVSSSDAVIRADWDPIDGALTYEIEAAIDSGFDHVFCRTRNNRPDTILPAPEGTGPETVFVRMRGIDVTENADGTREAVFGAWSRVGSLELAATPTDTSLPSTVLTSPVADYQSEGFTLILEWIADVGPQTRIQVSPSIDFQSTLYDTVVTGGEYVIPSPGLQVGDTLYWRARTWGSQKSAWSTARILHIGAPHQTQTDMFVNPEAPR